MSDHNPLGRLGRISIILGLAGAAASVVALVPEFGQWLFPKPAAEVDSTEHPSTEGGADKASVFTAASAPRAGSKEPEHVATLVVRRNQRFNSALVAYDVLLDDYLIDHIKNGEMKTYSIYPGRHRLTLRATWLGMHSTSNLVQFSLDQGQTLVVVCAAHVSADTPMLCLPGQ